MPELRFPTARLARSTRDELPSRHGLRRAVVVVLALAASACTDATAPRPFLRVPLHRPSTDVASVLPTLSVANATVTYPQPANLSGTAAPGASCTITDAGVPVASVTVDAAGNFASSVALGVGVHSLSATCTDGGGTSTSNDVTVTVLAPVSLSVPAAVAYPAAVAFSGSGAPGAGCAILDAGVGVATVTADATGSFSGSVQLSVGSHTLVATCTLNGQSSSSTPQVVVVQPTVTFNIATPTVTYPGAVGFSGTALGASMCTILDGSVNVANVTPDASGRFSGTLQLSPGVHSVVAQCGTGAVVVTSDALSVTVVVPIALEVGASSVVSPAPVTFTVTTAPFAQCTVSDNGTVVLTTLADATGRVAESLSLAVGTHQLTAQCQLNGVTSALAAASVTVTRSPLDELRNSLTTIINSLPLPATAQSYLLGLVSTLPAKVAGLTPTQKAIAIAKMQALIAALPTLPESCITPGQAQQISTLASEVIDVLRS